MSSLQSRLRFFALAACIAVPALPLMSQQVLDNAAVVKLAKSGLGEDLVVQTITASPGKFDTGTDALIALKQGGVTDKEIGAMITKGAGGGAAPMQQMMAPAGNGLPLGVDEVGVYYKAQNGAWVEFSPEIVNFKSGGVLKSFATNGIVKQDKNGHIPGATAKLTLNHPVEVLIYASEGTAPEEYQLLKLRTNSDNREFRSETGGVFHSSGGAERDRKDFTPNKIGPRLYTISLGPETIVGEYGILPPGAISSTNAASAGKIYTFHLAE